MNPVLALQEHGQAVWLDFLARGFIAKGDLKRLVDEIGARPAAQRAVALASKHKFKTEMDEEARNALFRHMAVKVA